MSDFITIRRVFDESSDTHLEVRPCTTDRSKVEIVSISSDGTSDTSGMHLVLTRSAVEQLKRAIELTVREVAGYAFTK